MKRKGVLLVVVIVIMVIFAILAVPLVNMISQNSNITYDYIIETKADEIAYGGYKIVEKYIIENKSKFTKDILASTDSKKVFDVNVHYTATDSRTVTITASNPVTVGKNLESVDLEARVVFGEQEGVYKQSINFNALVTPGSILFPEDPHYIITRGITGDKANDTYNIDKMDRKGLLERLSEREIKNVVLEDGEVKEFDYTITTLPEIATNDHIQWFKDNSNFLEIPISSNKTFNSNSITNWINQLANKQSSIDKENRNYLNVVYLKSSTGNHVSTFAGNKTSDTNDDYNSISHTYDINIDLTSLGNGVNETDFIIISNGNIKIISRYSSYTTRFNLKGGNTYFLANKSVKFSDTYNISNQFNIIHEIDRHESVSPQLTFASTTGRPAWALYYYLGNVQNTFLYYPDSGQIGSIFHNFNSPDYGKPVVSGGITLGQNPYSYANAGAYESYQFNRTYHSRSPWRGKLEYMGYLIK